MEERTAISAAVIREAIRAEGIDEINRPAIALWWSGLAAGFHGFHPGGARSDKSRPARCALVFSGLFIRLYHRVPYRGYRRRQLLFTENTVTAVILVFNHPSLVNLGKMFKL